MQFNHLLKNINDCWFTNYLGKNNLLTAAWVCYPSSRYVFHDGWHAAFIDSHTGPEFLEWKFIGDKCAAPYLVRWLATKDWVTEKTFKNHTANMLVFLFLLLCFFNEKRIKGFIKHESDYK